MNPKEIGKKTAAIQAVTQHLKNNQIVGIGSGSTITYAVEAIAARVKSEGLNIKCIPTSFQAKQLIIDHKLPLVTLEEYPELDVAFDGADESDVRLTLIKGGGGCLLQEKIIAFNAKEFIVVADISKNSVKLGEKWSRGVPLEVVPMAYRSVKTRIESHFGGQVTLRDAVKKMGPVVTDNGNFLMDWNFDTNKIYNWKDVDTQLHIIPGLVETGLFINMASMAYFGDADGTVITTSGITMNGDCH